ncbi:MAG TPA: hypothetical protein VE991_10575 [Acidimicrobiales bacterium]|nr:hypothetical protein [Acidimicrobiales bacterium]
MSVQTNRNSVGGATMAFYVMGMICLFSGIYASTITRLYIYTGQTTHPYLGVGIPLAIAGLVVVIVAQRIGKRNLSK